MNQALYINMNFYNLYKKQILKIYATLPFITQKCILIHGD